MKLAIITAIILFYLGNTNAQTWSQLTTPYNYIINSCWIDETSPNNGWFVGWRLAGYDPVSYGYKTIDGGNTFSLVYFNYYFWMAEDISFQNSNNGISVGSGIIQTVNGGEIWNVVVDNISMRGWMYDVMFADINNGYAVGQTYDYNYSSYWGVLYRTSNGGGSWNNSIITMETQNQNTEFRAVYSTGGGILYAGGLNTIGGSTLYKSINNGTSWTALSFYNSVNSLWFASADTGFAATNLGIFKTTNAGQTWNNILSTTQSLNSINIQNQTGFAVGANGLIYFTNDRGLNWTVMNSPVTNQTLNRVFVVSPTLAYAVGTNGTVLKFEGPVPVELTSFSASVANNKVQLKWTTATETNNSGFEIQRKMGEDKSQELEWEKIGFVSGFGTTAEAKSYSYIDKNIPSGIYNYRLKQIDYDGEFIYSEITKAEIKLPGNFSLEQNYPNPFNPSTKISFTIPEESKVTMKIFNVIGQEVLTLVENNFSAGIHSIDFNAALLESGVYFYKIEANSINSNNFTEMKKMVLIK